MAYYIKTFSKKPGLFSKLENKVVGKLEEDEVPESVIFGVKSFFKAWKISIGISAIISIAISIFQIIHIVGFGAGDSELIAEGTGASVALLIARIVGSLAGTVPFSAFVGVVAGLLKYFGIFDKNTSKKEAEAKVESIIENNPEAKNAIDEAYSAA